MLHQSLVPFPFLAEPELSTSTTHSTHLHPSYGPRAPAHLEKHKTPHETTALKSDALDLSQGAARSGKGKGRYSKELCNEENKPKP